MTQKEKKKVKRDNWQTKKLGEVAEVKGGGTPPTSVPEYFQGERNWFTPTEIPKYGVSSLAESQRKISPTAEQFTTISGTNSVLLSSRATIGTVGVLSAPSGYNQGIKGIEPHQGELDPWYLAHYLRSNTDEILSKASGTTFKEISTTEVKNLEIPLPSLEEQKRITKTLEDILGEIEKVKRNTEKTLQNSRELFESYLQNVFSNQGNDWEEKRLEDLGQITSSKRIYKKEYIDNGIPFYRIKEIKELANNKDISVELFISENRYQEIKRVFGVPVEGDILMTAVGTIGEIYVIENKAEFYFKDGNVLWFKEFKNVDSYFLKYILISFVEQIKNLSKGSAYNALTIEKIEKHTIFIPKLLSEQKTIVKKLDALSEQTKKLEEVYKQKLADLEELKKSILQKAFAGELVN